MGWTTDAQSPAHLQQFGRMPKGTGDIGDLLADFQGHEVPRTLADRLNDQGDRPRNGIAIGNGQGDPLGAFAALNDHELAGPANLGNPRSEHVQAGHVRTQPGFGDDFMHCATKLFKLAV